MRRYLVILTIVAALLAAIVLEGCGDIKTSAQPPHTDIVHVHAQPTVTTTTVSPVAVWTFTVAYNEWKQEQVLRWIAAVNANKQKTAPAGASRVSTTIRRTPAYTQYPSSYQPCGGTDYPPCWRVGTESGGDYNAYNPTGCGGAGCYGKWQFSGEWACKLGLPCDLRTATPAQQDNAAKLLWNQGAGCSNWSAC